MNALEDKLIENVKKYPILYRSKQNNFKNIMCKDTCWEEIATALKISPDECKAKWRNIRDSYNKNVKRKQTGTSKAISKYDNEKLDFLAERYGLREPLNIEYSASSNNSFEDEEKHNYDPLNDEFSEPSNPGSPPISQNKSDIVHPVQPTQTYSPSFIHSSLNPPEEEIKPRKKAMKRKIETTIEEVENDADERSIILQEMVEVAPRREGSPTHNFFSSMADIVCKFPAEKIAETRMRICTLVSEVEVQVLRDRSHSNLRR